MAIKKTVIIDADTSKAVKSVDDLNKSVKKLDKSAEDVGDGGISGIGEGAKSSTKSVGGLSGGFKGLGVAIKATGIGILIGLLVKLGESLGENERASRFFKVAAEAVSIVMQDFINFIIDNSGAVVDTFKAIFENPLESIKQLGVLIQENLIERFNSLLEVAGFLGDAFVKLFTGDFAGALDSVKEAGKEAVDVFTGIDGTTEKVAKGFNDISNSVSEYVSNVIDAAESNIDLARSAEIAAAQQALLIEQFDRQAEKLRQIRDNDLKGIDERIEANKKLKNVLDEQEKAMIAQANAILASASAQFNKNRNTENEIALLDAQANKAGVLAQIEGLRSEQEANRIALQKESLELNQSIIDGETERELKRKEFTASLEDDTLKRLELERQVLEEERIIEAERLQLKIDSFAEGTQARIDAENELKNFLLENENELKTNKIESDNEIAKNKEDAAKREKELDKIVQDNKKALISDGLATIQGLLKKGSAAGKGIAAAQTIFDTQQGITAALAAKGTDSLLPFPVRLANAALVGIKGALALKNILSTDPTTGAGGSADNSASGGGQQAPAFNLVGGSGVNQIQESIESEAAPIQAFVVGSEVTSQQSLDRNLQDSATLG